MRTALLFELENAMQNFLDKNCEADEWPDGYCYDELSSDMARAAEVVFDANFAGQAYQSEAGGNFETM